MTAPVITITGITATRISAKAGKDVSVITFKSDQDLVEWVAKANGNSPTTGDNVGKSTGGGITTTIVGRPLIYSTALFGKGIFCSESKRAKTTVTTVLPAGVSADFEVENEELLSGDGQYQINVYGKNARGEWSGYGQ